jgi:hypothetical protein
LNLASISLDGQIFKQNINIKKVKNMDIAKAIKDIREAGTSPRIEFVEPKIVDSRIFETKSMQDVEADPILSLYLYQNFKVKINGYFYTDLTYIPVRVDTYKKDDESYFRYANTTQYVYNFYEDVGYNFYVKNIELMSPAQEYGYTCVLAYKHPFGYLRHIDHLDVALSTFLAMKNGNHSNQLEWQSVEIETGEKTAKLGKRENAEAIDIVELPYDYVRKTVQSFGKDVPEEVFYLYKSYDHYVFGGDDSRFRSLVGRCFKGMGTNLKLAPRDTTFAFVAISISAGRYLEAGDSIQIVEPYNYMYSFSDIYPTPHELAMLKNARMLWNVDNRNSPDTLYCCCLVALRKQVGLDIADASVVLLPDQTGVLVREDSNNEYSLEALDTKKEEKND